MTKRIIIGTANFGRLYDGVLVPKDEQEKIWDYCREVGIDVVDTATAYGKIDIPNDFKVINKIRAGDVYPKDCYKVLAHYAMDFRSFFDGVSLYYPAELCFVINSKPKILQVSYKTFKMWLPELKRRGIEIYVRNVFKDRVFEQALADSNVDKVIIGIDNVEQLREDVEIVRRIVNEPITKDRYAD